MKKMKTRNQRALANARYVDHLELPSRTMDRPVVQPDARTVSISSSESHWFNSTYYGMLRRYASGFPIGGGPYAILSITARDETARHDWREFQQLKNHLLGAEWEAVELYPAESRLIDPSNRFYLWCVPRGVFTFGLPSDHRRVIGPIDGAPAQRAFG
jgi:hypothetical protein